MTVGLHRSEDPCHLPGRVDDERAAHDAQALPAVEGLFAPRAIPFRDRMVGVAQQRERQRMFRAKGRMALRIVATDTEHDRAVPGELRHGVAKATGLAGAAGGIVLGVEIEDDRLAAEARQLQFRAVVGREREVRGLCTFRDPVGHGLAPRVRVETYVERRVYIVAAEARGCPCRLTRTFAAALQASAHSMPPALRHPWLRLSATPARRHGQPLAASSRSRRLNFP